jgi:hypothetical protein
MDLGYFIIGLCVGLSIALGMRLSGRTPPLNMPRKRMLAISLLLLAVVWIIVRNEVGIVN